MCIGSHLRHILDFYDCVFDGLYTDIIDLTNRKSDELIHCECDYALIHVERIINMLQKLCGNSLAQDYLATNDRLR